MSNRLNAELVARYGPDVLRYTCSQPAPLPVGKDAKWFAFKCKGREEAMAAAALEQSGIETLYLYQTEEVFRRRAGGHRTERTEVENPILCAYAFARHSNLDWLRWRVDQLTHVYWQDRYRKLTPLNMIGPLVGRSVPQFDALRAMSGSRVEIPKPHEFAAGDLAKLTAGPFATNAPITIEVVTKTKARITIGSIPMWVQKEHLQFVPESIQEKAA